MQKKIIALAIAGLSATSAFAADSVTLYGVVDMFAASLSGDTVGAGGSVNSGGLSTSRIGFKGVEDLGGGLKAAFVLEYRLSIDQNTGIGGDKNTQTVTNSVSGAGAPTAVTSTATQSASTSGPARQQMIAVVSNAGTFAAGRLQTAAYDWAIKFGGALAGSRVDAYGNLTAKQNLISGVGLAARASNAVAYISPSFSGVTLAVNYANKVDNVTSDDLAAAGGTRSHASLFSLTYDNGPLSVGGVYATLSSPVNGAATAFAPAGTFVLSSTSAFGATALQGTTKEWALGASYDLGVAKLGATYQRFTLDSSAFPALPGNLNTYQLNVSAPVGSGVVAASYAATKNNILDNGSSTDHGAKSWSLGYVQPLSKRTKLYAAYSTVTNGSGTSAYFVDNQATNTGINGTDGKGAGGKSNILAAGINHSF